MISALLIGMLWSMQDCIEFGLKNNIGLQQKEITVNDSDLALQTAKFSRLPDLSANVGENANFGRSQNREGVFEDHSALSTSAGVSTSIPVFKGFEINNRIGSEKLNLEAATLDLEQARQDLSLEIVAYYLNALYAKESEAIAMEQVEINSQLVERTRLLVQGGKTTESELFNAQSSLAAAKSQLVQASNEVRTSLLDLAQSINFTDFNTFDIEVPDIDGLVLSEYFRMCPPDSIYNDCVEGRPSVMAARKRVEKAEKDTKVAQSARWPSIWIGASYNTAYYSSRNLASGNASFLDQLGQNGATTIGATLSIPIFNKLATRNSILSAKNRQKSAALELEQTRISVYKEVQHAYVNATGAWGEYQAQTGSVDAARKAFEFEKKKYESGRSTTFQFNESRQKLATAISQMTQAKFNFIYRAKILDFYRGTPLY